MPRCLLVLFITTLISFDAHSSQENCDAPLPDQLLQSTLDFYEKQYLELKGEPVDWQKTADVLLLLAFAVIILGATVAALQPIPDTARKKWIIGIIGILIASTTYLRDTLFDGSSYRSFQQAINKAKSIGSDIDKDLASTQEPGLPSEVTKTLLTHICKNVTSLQELRTAHSVDLPQFLDFFIKTAAADNLPDWVSQPPSQGWIVSGGEGLSLSEAKSNAEQDGYTKISSAIGRLIDASFSKPIHSSLKKEVQESLMKMGQVKKISFDTSKSPITYWILYSIDEKTISGILSGTAFPLTIFSTDLIANKVETLNNELTEFGFTVTVSTAPRGPSSETNAIFVGEGVPVDAVKKTVRVLVDQGIPLKAIIYPWRFRKSDLPEIQKINHLQIGGSDLFEAWPKLSENDLDKLHKISSQNDLTEYSKTAMDQLKELLN